MHGDPDKQDPAGTLAQQFTKGYFSLGSANLVNVFVKGISAIHFHCPIPKGFVP